MDTVLQLLAFQAQTRARHRPAILAPDQTALPYRALHTSRSKSPERRSQTSGLGRGSRIALALGNRPETAVATLAAMSWCACAPLNPALNGDTAMELLSRLRIDALIAAEGDASALVEAARGLRLTLVRLRRPDDGSAGMFVLRAERARPRTAACAPASDDLALVMQTSGTTSMPKIVPLSHAQVLACARQFPLVADDRALSVTPLFTKGALGVDLFAPLAAGASTVITPGFDAARFVDWVDDFRPTFYSASPTIQTAILEALDRRKPAPPCSLRYARASSKALPQTVQRSLEAALGVPVVQGYGMTESGLIAQNPVAPGKQRLGSAGLPRDIEVSVRDADGRVLAPGAIGEVTVRGPSVMSGYEDDTEANRLAFGDGWFRTGDLGYFDGDGYLFLTGRVNEVVNRGGLKVSPAEVDEIFTSHPEVLEAVSFPVPHPSLGDDLAVAVVLRASAQATPQALREFAIDRLLPHKVPSAVIVVPELPRNALGKVWRRGLADTLGAALQPAYFAAARSRPTHSRGNFRPGARRISRRRTGQFFLHRRRLVARGASAVADRGQNRGADGYVVAVQVADRRSLRRTNAGSDRRWPRTRSAAAGRGAPRAGSLAMRQTASVRRRALRAMRQSRIGNIAALAFSVAASLAPSPGSAQDYPVRPVKIVVGQTAGSAADALARLIGESLTGEWSQPVTIENKSGAAGTIAADLVAKAPADGYALLLGGQGNLVVAGSLDPNLRYDPTRDFAPIGRLARTPLFLVMNSGVPARTLPELIAYAKAHPGKLTYISYGDGSVSRVAFEWLKTAAGIDLLEIPYKGAAPAMADLLAGRVDMGLNDFAAVEQYVDLGTLRLVAALGAKRATRGSGVATVAEQGIEGYSIEAWYGILAPAGTAPEVVAKIANALDRIRRMPAFRQRLAELSYEPVVDTPAQFEAAIRSGHREVYADIVKRARIDARRNPRGAAQ